MKIHSLANKNIISNDFFFKTKPKNKISKIENYVAKHFEVEKHSQRYKCEHCDFMTKNLKELEKHKKEENNKEFDDLYKRPIENVQPEKNGETSALDQ